MTSAAAGDARSVGQVPSSVEVLTAAIYDRYWNLTIQRSSHQGLSARKNQTPIWWVTVSESSPPPWRQRITATFSAETLVGALTKAQAVLDDPTPAAAPSLASETEGGEK